MGPCAQDGLCLVYCSVVVILKFLILMMKGSHSFISHWALESFIAGPAGSIKARKHVVVA